MIKHFPIADELHLLHLGVMKKLMLGWIKGTFNKKNKWSAFQITNISNWITDANLPIEINRNKLRSLDLIHFWKGAEFRSFMLYLSATNLRHHLEKNVYLNFLKLFCAITICSSSYYILKYLDLAEKLLLVFVTEFGNIYGSHFMSSNIHNLVHLIEDVKEYGELSSFSTYPFETTLGCIKRLLRSGANPLEQAAKRIIEIHQSQTHHETQCEINDFVLMGNTHGKPTLDFKDFVIRSDFPNKWFLTKNKEIVAFKDAKKIDGEILILGESIKEKHDLFDLPVKSSHLNIFECKLNFNQVIYYPSTSVHCKLVAVNDESKTVFLPLLHTLS